MLLYTVVFLTDYRQVQMPCSLAARQGSWQTIIMIMQLGWYEVGLSMYIIVQYSTPYMLYFMMTAVFALGSGCMPVLYSTSCSPILIGMLLAAASRTSVYIFIVLLQEHSAGYFSFHLLLLPINYPVFYREPIDLFWEKKRWKILSGFSPFIHVIMPN